MLDKRCSWGGSLMPKINVKLNDKRVEPEMSAFQSRVKIAKES